MGWWVNCLTVDGSEPQVGQFFAPTWPGTPAAVEIKIVQSSTGNEHHDVSPISSCTGGTGGPTPGPGGGGTGGTGSCDFNYSGVSAQTYLNTGNAPSWNTWLGKRETGYNNVGCTHFTRVVNWITNQLVPTPNCPNGGNNAGNCWNNVQVARKGEKISWANDMWTQCGCGSIPEGMGSVYRINENKIKIPKKITKGRLKNIIKEELKRSLLKEQSCQPTIPCGPKHEWDVNVCKCVLKETYPLREVDNCATYNSWPLGTQTACCSKCAIGGATGACLSQCHCCPGGRGDEEEGCRDSNYTNFMKCCPPDQNNPECIPVIHNQDCCGELIGGDKRGCTNPQGSGTVLNMNQCCPGAAAGCVPNSHYEPCCEYERGGNPCEDGPNAPWPTTWATLSGAQQGFCIEMCISGPNTDPECPCCPDRSVEPDPCDFCCCEMTPTAVDEDKKPCVKQMSCADGYHWNNWLCDCVENTPWWSVDHGDKTKRVDEQPRGLNRGVYDDPGDPEPDPTTGGCKPGTITAPQFMDGHCRCLGNTVQAPASISPPCTQFTGPGPFVESPIYESQKLRGCIQRELFGK